MRIILSVVLICACMAGMVSWVLCAMWPMRCTHVATAPQLNAEPSRQNEDWRQSAAADGPNTVDPSPASNTASNTSETKPEFASNPNEMMVPNASKKRPSFANGPRILVASNASEIISVTYGGREHVAADNTYEVSELNATGHKISRFRKWRCRQWICC
ncbi:hypothetical protein TcCL_ESM08835 [Trypanosoma cruzi]|nr:hypothetical protein TcCL_ESM08835 [Trypanosoma cruzi]